MELVSRNVGLVDMPFQVVKIFFFAQRDHGKLVVEVVEHDDVPIENIVHIRGIVALHGLVPYGNILKIAHRIERCIAIKSTKLSALSLNLQPGKK